MPHNPRERMQRVATAVTGWVGSLQSVVVHTLVFLGSFFAVWAGFIAFDKMLLVLTTLVSLEAIYLSIFIQMSLNVTRESLAEVEEDIDEIQQDVDEIQQDVDEIQEDIEEEHDNPQTNV
jgi:low affinity Fe/Cu permease